MSQRLHKSRSKFIQEKMDRTGRSITGRRCYLLMIILITGWIFLFFHFLVFMDPGRPSPLKLIFSSQNSMFQPLFKTDKKLPSDQKVPDFSPATRRLWQPLKRFGAANDTCAGKYVFMHDLPREFNQEMLDKCLNLSLWTNMCKYTANAGLGPPLEDSEGSFSKTGWFGTNQFSVEVIFHNRMKQYSCLTKDPSKAIAFFVPFYAGLDISRHLWGASTQVRDSAALALADWLKNRPEWEVMGGTDHFMVAGRITWDFRRKTEQQGDWGNKLLLIPALKNMTSLVIEASPWHQNDVAIPYPTYFHPSQDSEVIEWQERMRSTDRTSLFSFAGAPRPEIRTSIRGQIMEQCQRSTHCKLLECDFGESKCHIPSVVMKLFEESVFCLQPQGDSFTRRSIFDSMLAGCIPVFFHRHSAYSQYIWHFPANYSTYSVFISEQDIQSRNVSIEAVLLQIPPETVQCMREEVIKLIPGIIYADPQSQLQTIKDAFEVTVEAVVKRIEDFRMQILEGREIEGIGGSDDLDILTTGKESSVTEDTTRRWEGQRRKGEQEGSEIREHIRKRD